MDIAGLMMSDPTRSPCAAVSVSAGSPDIRAKSLKFRSLPVGTGNVNANRPASTMCSMQIAAVKPSIALSVLDQLDIRVGTILGISEVPASDKLMQLAVDFGDHQRTIVAGIRQERADPSEVVGKQALFVVNLEPRKIKGVLSQGMLFDIGYADGITPVLAMPEKPVPNGCRAG
jgi:tRNA-binding protein